MAEDIVLNYKITNAKAAQSTIPDNYLIVADVSQAEDFIMPPELGGQFTNVYLTDENDE